MGLEVNNKRTLMPSTNVRGCSYSARFAVAFGGVTHDPTGEQGELLFSVG